MGQITYGLCYGVPAEAFRDHDSEALFEDYESAKEDELNTLVELPSTLTWWQAVRRIVPRWVWESTPFCGFFVAAGASGMDDLPHLNGCRIASVESDERYKEPLARAAKAWQTFAAWCLQRDIDLPAAELWLVECEVA